MTDGIIQKTFKDFWTNYPYSKSKDYINRKSINKLQQELISKITQSIEKDLVWHYSRDGKTCKTCYEKETLEKLIGDTK